MKIPLRFAYGIRCAVKTVSCERSLSFLESFFKKMCACVHIQSNKVLNYVLIDKIEVILDLDFYEGEPKAKRPGYSLKYFLSSNFFNGVISKLKFGKSCPLLEAFAPFPKHPWCHPCV